MKRLLVFLSLVVYGRLFEGLAGAAQTGFIPSFYIGSSAGSSLNPGSDVKQFYASQPDANIGYENFVWDGHVGYLFSRGFALEGGYEGFFRWDTASYSLGIATNDSWNVMDSLFWIEPLYRLRLSKRLLLDGGVRLGEAFAVMQVVQRNNYTGYGFAAEPELRLEILAGRQVGLQLGLGYRYADISPMQDKKTGRSLTFVNSQGNDEIWHLNDSGLVFRFGMNIYVNSMLN
jgi:hypothetical protein